MGDNTTHAIFYDAYWHLVFEDEDGNWVSTDTYNRVCVVGTEKKKVNLEEIK